MKYKFLPIIFLLVYFISCRKDEMKTRSIASLRVVNAVIDGKTVKLNSNLRDSALNLNNKLFSISSGNQPLYIYPVGDSTKPYFKNSIEAADGDIYSLYLFGKSPAEAETLLVKEAFEPYYGDSAFAVRFVNLCANSAPLSFTLGSDPDRVLASNVGLKTVTAFVKLPLTASAAAIPIVFQARKADKSIVASYTLPEWPDWIYGKISIGQTRYRRITIVVKGVEGATSGSNAVNLFPVENY